MPILTCSVNLRPPQQDNMLALTALALLTGAIVIPLSYAAITAARAGAWTTFTATTVVVLAALALSVLARRRLFSHTLALLSDRRRWSAIRASGPTAPVEQWTEAWMSLKGCRCGSLASLAGSRRDTVARRFGVHLPMVIFENTAREAAASQTPADGELSASSTAGQWRAFSLDTAARLLAKVFGVALVGVVLIVIAIIIDQYSLRSNASLRTTIAAAFGWTGVAVLLLSPLVIVIWNQCSIGTASFSAGDLILHRRLRPASASRSIPLHTTAVFMLHRHTRHFVLVDDNSKTEVWTAVVLKTRTSPSMVLRIPADHVGRFMAECTRAAAISLAASKPHQTSPQQR